MATRAVHTVYQDFRTRGNGNTVILVVDMGVSQDDVVAGRDVESVRVVGGCLTATFRVGLISNSVVQKDIREGDGVAVRDIETVDGPVLYVQVLEASIVDMLCDDEVVGLSITSIATLSVPVRLSISVYDVTVSAFHHDISSRDHDRVEFLVVCILKSGLASKNDMGSSLQRGEIDSARGRGFDVGEDDIGARGHS